MSTLGLQSLARPMYTPSGRRLNPVTISSDGKTISDGGVKPNSTVTVYANGTQVGTATADGSGNWSYVFGTAPAAGTVIGYDGVLAGPTTTVPQPGITLDHASFAVNAAAGTLIGNFQNLQASETIVSVSPNDGTVAINSGGTAALVGLSASSAGTRAYTFTSSTGRVDAQNITASAAPTVYRADATNLSMSNVLPNSGGGTYGVTSRDVAYVQKARQAGTTAILSIPLWAFSPAGTILEYDLPRALDFACAIEYPYQQATSGLNPANRYRATVMGGSSRVYHYDPTVGALVPHAQFTLSWPANTPAQAQVGVWCTMEAPLGRAQAVTNALPQRVYQAHNQIQRYQGHIVLAARAFTITGITNSGTNAIVTVSDASAFVAGLIGSSIAISGVTDVTAYNGNWVVTAINGGSKQLTIAIGQSGLAPSTSGGTADPSLINSDAIANATAVAPFGSTNGSGTTAYLTVGCISFPDDGSSFRTLLSSGNSKQQGDFEGANGSLDANGVVHGDRNGDPYGNRGPWMRLGWARGMGVGHGDKGSDRDPWRLITPSYTGAISGTALTVSAVSAGMPFVGQTVNGAGVTAGTRIVAMNALVGTISGTTLTVTQLAPEFAATIGVGTTIVAAGYFGTVTALGTGTGGTGTYTLNVAPATTISSNWIVAGPLTVSASQTVSSTALTGPQNSARRNQWKASAVNPHRVGDMCSTNELSSTGILAPPPATAYPASGTAVALDKVVFNGANFYVCGSISASGAGTGAGATAGVAPTGTTYGTGYVDGSVTWYYVGSTLSGSAASAGSQDCYGAGWVGQRRQRLRIDYAAMPSATFFGVTQTPLTNSYSESVTSGNYAYNATSGVLTITVSGPSHFQSGALVTTAGLSVAAMNGINPATLSGSTLSVQLATGLATPTGTLTVTNNFEDAAGQTLQTTYATPAAAQVSMRSWINRFLRTPAAIANVLGYAGVLDTSKYVESGNATTPGAETAVWGNTTDGGGHVSGLTAEGGHENSYGYEIEVNGAIANDSALMTALAA